jgi:serine/threonine protein kinase
MSHEIYQNQDFYAAAVDIWALGVILFIMLTGGQTGEREEGREGRRESGGSEGVS